MSIDSGALDALLHEDRRFPPPEAFVAGAVASDPGVYERAAADPEAYWAEWAGQLDWFEPWHTVLEWKSPHAKWFLGGKLNVAHNCLDRHVERGRSERTALIWEGEPGDTRTFTYGALHEEVCKFANALKGLGLGRGDRVTIYLPMIPEAAVAMLACTRIGAIHSVVFGGFSPDSLADRNNDAESKVLITSDGGWRRGSVLALKENADAALDNSPTVEHVVVVARGGELTERTPVTMKEGRDHWYHELMAEASSDCPAERMDAEDTQSTDVQRMVESMAEIGRVASRTAEAIQGVAQTSSGQLASTRGMVDASQSLQDLSTELRGALRRFDTGGVAP